ncbi:hypothetical protein HWV62_16998 [Athelia sp. TMB]|nr:hypothetical protein HWV62_16998 [Athelia sp. TMB]
MAFLLSAVALYLLSITQAVVAKPCIAFDSTWNLYAFGLDGKDYNASSQAAWTSSAQSRLLLFTPANFSNAGTPAADITTTGRPPFDGANTTCYLAQYFNAIYVINGDVANPNSVYIYNVATPGWSMQQTTPGGFSFANFGAILDHDTNVFSLRPLTQIPDALSSGEMYFLDMGDLITANSTAISWTDVGPSPYGASYDPVMAIANNHIHFLDVPSVPAGSADIFVIHFSWYQPFTQAYPLVNGESGTIPNTQGQVASFFQESNTVQQEFAFIPQDSSNTYVINVMTNDTQQLAGPTTKDPLATYFAGVTSLVQLSSSGAVSFLPYTQGDDAGNSAATWTPVAALAAAVPASTSSASSSATASASAGSAKSSGTATAGSSSSTPQAAGAGINGASSSHHISNALAGFFAIAALVCLL